MSSLSFSNLELEQYSRHLTLPGFGMERQIRLKNASVLMVGAGGLGCPAALYMAAAGVGQITVVDFDRVERSNLQRQIAFSETDLSCYKAERLVERLRGINPFVQYVTHTTRLDETNVMALVQNKSLVLDGTDNFITRFLLADACYLSQTPLLQGAVQGFSAQVSLFPHHNGIDPCYRCLFRQPPQNPAATCDEMGILGILPGMAGLIMATESIKFLTSLGTSLAGKLLLYNSLDLTTRLMTLAVDETCPLCQTQVIQKPEPVDIETCRSVHRHQKERHEDLTMNNGENDTLTEITVQELALLRQKQPEILLVDVREAFEHSAGAIPNSVNVPLSVLEAVGSHREQLLQQFPQNVQTALDTTQETGSRDTSVVLYCQKGGRSFKALELLEQHAFNSLPVSLAGGYLAWKENNT
jgi:sulfur-carrier protein adenylyltransferase/sulfurtransferase